jgi:cellulose biosynthesis protein BcsS
MRMRMMMISNFRTYVSPAIVGSLAVVVTLLCASHAQAQTEATLLASIPLETQRPPSAVFPTPPAAIRVTPAPAFWELISGYEGDTHGSGYGFVGPSYVRPIRPGLSWTARAFGNYLSYEFSSVGGATSVRSPGLSTAIGLQFGDKNFFRVLAGPEVKWRRTEVTGANGLLTTSTDTRAGANAGGEMYVNPTPHNNVQGLINYNTTDRYSWGRLGFKEQLNNRSWKGPVTTYLGVEGVAQGNQDIRSTEAGAFFEVNPVPAKISVVFKAGYKRSTFTVGPDKTGPYFSVGFYQRLR